MVALEIILQNECKNELKDMGYNISDDGVFSIKEGLEKPITTGIVVNNRLIMLPFDYLEYYNKVKLYNPK